jgi:hypothetical protein
MKKLFVLLSLAVLYALSNPAGLVLGQSQAAEIQGAQGPPEVSLAVQHDVSPPLRTIQPDPPKDDAPREKPLRLIPGDGTTPHQPDPVVQSSAPGPAVATGAGVSGDGLPADGYAPPDANGAVGATQYVQWVNVNFAVFDKATGAMVYGPAAGNTLWKGFGGPCEANNSGDPIAQYDKAAGRWVMTQPVFTAPYYQCVAVSQTSDATGAYNRYAFSMGNQFPDYPKLGVWRDGYYISFNMFRGGRIFAGAKVCAYDRNAMLAAAAASQQCFQLSTRYGGLLPADLDGTVPPPAGAPNYLLNLGSNALGFWKFHVDWATPTNSTLTGPSTVAGVAAFTSACNGGTCIPQIGTTQKLDSLADRLMYRLAYRNLGDHEALVVNHSVSVSTGAASGIRWYEVRNPSGTPAIFQQGTYSPDGKSRWMGSIAMDKVGDLALGYSASSDSIYPSIRYTGRVPSDPLNLLQAESVIKDGSGSQLPNLSRWGDYSSMSVDPIDDCTFWYTSEYLNTSGTFNWRTYIASFKFPGCQ